VQARPKWYRTPGEPSALHRRQLVTVSGGTRALFGPPGLAVIHVQVSKCFWKFSGMINMGHGKAPAYQE
jgi:hypothetical protein